MPLILDCWNTVIQHLDPNLKLDLFVSIPELAKEGKRVPIEFETVQIEDNCVTVNDYTYALAITRLLPMNQGTGPRHLDDLLPNVEVDDYGFNILTVQEEGDLDFGNERLQLTTMDELREIEGRFPAQERFFGRDAVAEHRAKNRDEIARFLLKESQSDPGFKLVLTLTVTSPLGRVLRRQTLHYSQNMHTAARHLVRKLLNGQVSVKTLTLTAREYLPRPADLKLTVKNLVVTENQNGLSMFRDLLTPESFPLDSVSIINLHENDVEFFPSVAKLIFRRYFHQMDSIPTLRHPRVHFERSSFDPSHAVAAARNWMDHGRATGTHFTFVFRDYGVDNIMARLDREIGLEPSENDQGPDASPRFFALPINAVSEIRFRMNFDRDIMDMKVSVKNDPCNFE